MKKIYENYYVSPNGEVFNRFNKKLSPCNNGRGYLVLGLTVNGKRFTKAIHRLVAEAYVENPNGLEEVNHKDGNRLNNNMENLEWVTHSENIKHSYVLGNRSAKGSKNANSKTTEEIVHQICQHILDELSSSEIRDLGYSYILVRSIKTKSNWSHISDLYFKRSTTRERHVNESSIVGQ